MLKPIQTILFATDLTTDCLPALDFTIVMATRFQAAIHLLHVIEKLPVAVDSHLQNILGRHKWEELVDAQRASVHQSMTGKVLAISMLREDINNFCKLANIDDGDCNPTSREIIITEGDIADRILAHAKENQCDLIVLGGKAGILSQTSVGHVIKLVLKNAKIPVTVVPNALN